MLWIVVWNEGESHSLPLLLKILSQLCIMIQFTSKQWILIVVIRQAFTLRKSRKAPTGGAVRPTEPHCTHDGAVHNICNVMQLRPEEDSDMMPTQDAVR